MKNQFAVSMGLVAIALIALSSVTDAGGRAGTVSGRALDTKGRPIAGAKVWVKPVVTTGLYETRTDANGRYEATGLPPVGYRVMAWFEKEYQGKRFCLRLGHPNVTDYTPVNPAQGATRDLLWRTQGRIEDIEVYSDMGFFGGSVTVMNEYSVPARNAPLEFTLTPTGPLIDGSTGKILTRKPNAEGYLFDVPVGVYRVTAALLENGAKKPVRLGSTSDSLGNQATLEFNPEKTSCVGNSASGVGRAYLYWGKGGAASVPTSKSGTTGISSSPGTTGVSSGAGKTSSRDGMAGTWDGTLTIDGGQEFQVRYVLHDTEYGDGFVGITGEFLECSSEDDCTMIGKVSRGKRVPGALVNFTTTLGQSGASFETVGHLEGETVFKGLTDAAFTDGKEAVLKLTRR